MNINDLFNRQSAGSGFKQVSGASIETAVAGTYFAVQFVTDCTTTAFAAKNSTSIAAVTYPAGMVVYGNITAITCSADNIYILYKS